MNYMTPPDGKAIENIGFMLQDVARLMRCEYNRRVQELALTQAQWRALSILSRKPGLRQNQLAEMLEMQPISIGRLIDRLQAAGWVERKADPTDRRALQLYLTAQSEPILAQLKKHGAACRAAVLAGVSEEEQREFLDILSRMRANMAAAVEGECRA
jgi:MarR family transcriptional regulator, transcriptional regulator for hemolysin